MDSYEVFPKEILPLGDTCLVSEFASICCTHPYFCITGFDIQDFLMVIVFCAIAVKKEIQKIRILDDILNEIEE